VVCGPVYYKTCLIIFLLVSLGDIPFQSVNIEEKMANRGPAFGLSRECAMKAQAKFDLERAQTAMDWIGQLTGKEIALKEGQLKDSDEFGEILKNGHLLCETINRLQPGTIKKINTLKTPFKERENIELYLKGCESYGLKTIDLFQVNDLYEAKNLYTVVDNIFALGGMAQKVGFEGPSIGARVSQENKRAFDDSVLKAGQSVIGLQVWPQTLPYLPTLFFLPTFFRKNSMHFGHLLN